MLASLVWDIWFDGRRWVEKARAPAIVEVDTDEEVKMDIPPPLPTAPASPYSPPPAPSTTAGTSSVAPDWYHDLSQHIDTLNLDLRLFLRSKIADLEHLITVLGHLITTLGSFKLRFFAS